MRSRISFFNRTVFRKDMIRFAPAWVIFAAGCMLVVGSSFAYCSPALAGELLTSSLSAMALVNFLYAPVCALLLYGDLFKARLCNALHAMPLRRETWFGSHFAAGCCFGLIPYALTAGYAAVILGWNWSVAPVWLLGCMLEYLFFFSTAVLCVFCTGSRFAATVVYGLLNFLAVIAAWFAEVIYAPLMTGLTLDISWAQPLSPLIYLMENCDWESWFDKISRSQYGIGTCWSYLLGLTVLTLGFLALALVLYRRRKLESAGDFIAVRGLGPVFLVVYTLSCAVIAQLVGTAFLNSDRVGIFFIVGLVIGWYTGLMLLQRTLRVFRGRTLLGLVVVLAVILISLLLAWADPLGLTRWVPEVENVSSVKLDNYAYYSGGVEISDPEKIADITDIHSQAIAENVDSGDGSVPSGLRTFTLKLSYHLENGKTAERTYELAVSTDLAQRLIPYFSDPQVILGYEDWERFLEELYQIRVDWNDELIITGEDAVSLAEAIRADCEMGTMAQYWAFHVSGSGDYEGAAVGVDIVAGDRHFDFTVYYDCENTINWLREHDAWPDYLE